MNCVYYIKNASLPNIQNPFLKKDFKLYLSSHVAPSPKHWDVTRSSISITFDKSIFIEWKNNNDLPIIYGLLYEWNFNDGKFWPFRIITNYIVFTLTWTRTNVDNFIFFFTNYKHKQCLIIDEKNIDQIYNAKNTFICIVDDSDIEDDLIELDIEKWTRLGEQNLGPAPKPPFSDK